MAIMLLFCSCLCCCVSPSHHQFLSSCSPSPPAAPLQLPRFSSSPSLLSPFSQLWRRFLVWLVFSALARNGVVPQAQPSAFWLLPVTHIPLLCSTCLISLQAPSSLTHNRLLCGACCCCCCCCLHAAWFSLGLLQKLIACHLCAIWRWWDERQVE